MGSAAATLRRLARALALGASLVSAVVGCATGTPIDPPDETAASADAGLGDPDGWLRQVYLDVLSREPDAGGLAHWAGELEGGTEPVAVVRAFFASDEWRSNFVRVLYGMFLHRAADDGGLGHHVGTLQGGASLEDVMTAFLSSEEYFAAQCGSDRTTFVRNLYRDVLARPGSDAEVAAWVASGVDRAGMARAFVTSAEYRRLIVQLYYGVYLDRGASAPEIDGWVGQIAGGLDLREVAARFLTSQEYIDRFGGGGGTSSCPIPTGEPQKKVLFTVGNAGEDLTIENELRTLLAGVVAGSEVRIAIYTFKRPQMADAIRVALDRGANVKIVVDGESGLSPAVQALKDDYPGQAELVTKCDQGNGGGGCLGTNINHNKFVTFTELCDGSRDVVVQSSANWTDTQLTAHNNAVVVRNDPALHAAYRGYWKAMKREQLDASDPFAPYSSHGGDTGTRAIFFPRKIGQPANEATDTVWEILDNVDCDPSSDDDFVYVAEALWGDPRAYLVTKLKQLQTAGCRVEIKVNEELDAAEVRQRLDGLLPNHRAYRPRIHSKYLAIHARFNGSAHMRDLVFTGSHNLNLTSLRSNDETILRLEDAGVLAAFKDNFENAL